MRSGVAGWKVSSRRAKARVGVHEHEVEELVGRAARALVVAGLVALGRHEDVAHAADAQGAGVARGLQQRHELDAELLAPEREHLDEHDVGRQPLVGGEDGLLADGQGAVGGAPAVQAREPAVEAHADRRQGDHLDPGGDRHVLGHAPALQDDDAEALGERARERERTDEVPEAERVLAVEEDRRARHHASAPVSDARAARRTAARCSRPSGRIRLTARSARSESSAAATCQPRTAGAGSTRRSA